ncbi:MAG TPA: DUF4214 domain-containing protein [Iamia sp.]|nr:DUF4214 domain-containing protein [Iamia sp.]
MMKTLGAWRLLIVGSIIAATGLGLAAPPAGAVQALVVSPATGLLDQQVVTVTGTGFDYGRELTIAQCAGALPVGCELDPAVNTTAAYVTVTKNGTISATLRLSRVLELDSGDVSCADGACSIVAVARAGSPERARTPIDFEATGTAAPAPDATLAIATTDRRADGASSTWTGSGYLPWFRAVQVAFDVPGPIPTSVAHQVGPRDPAAYMAVCAPSASGWGGCERFVSPVTVYGSCSGCWFKFHQLELVAANGTVSRVRELPRMVDTEDGRIDCAVSDCGFALEQDGAPHSNVVDVSWAPEWAPYPSANAFVSAVYPAVLGRAATPSERATAVSGLTARSLTGFTLLRRLAGEDEDGRRLAELSRLYTAALGRPADGPGLLYWAGELARTGSISGIAAAMGRSPEFRSVFGSVSNDQAVTLAYQRTLGRNPGPNERSYWVGRLQAGLARTHMVHLFSRSPEFVTRERPASEAVAVSVALLGEAPEDVWSLGPGFNPRDPRTQTERVDDSVLTVLSSDQLIDQVG